jgi:hypothetical protein
MKRTAQGKKREIQKKADEVLKRTLELDALLKALPEFEKSLRHAIATMPTLARSSLPQVEPFRIALFQYKDLVRTMNRNNKTLSKRVRQAGAELFEKQSNYALISRALNAQLKILVRMKKDAKVFIATSRELVAEGSAMNKGLARLKAENAKSKAGRK